MNCSTENKLKNTNIYSKFINKYNSVAVFATRKQLEWLYNQFDGRNEALTLHNNIFENI